MVPVAAILAAKAEHPTMGHVKIAKLVGSSAGSVRRVLLGIGTPRKMLKNKVKPHRRVPYAGSEGGDEWKAFK